MTIVNRLIVARNGEDLNVSVIPIVVVVPAETQFRESGSRKDNVTDSRVPSPFFLISSFPSFFSHNSARRFAPSARGAAGDRALNEANS